MSTYLSIVNFVLMQNLIAELLINMSQRHCGVERNPTSLLPFEVYLFVQKDITNRSGQNIEGTNADVKTPHKSEATRNSWPHNYIFRSHLR